MRRETGSKTAYLAAGLVALGLMAAGSTAVAEEGKIYDWDSAEAPVLISNDSGLIFLGTDKAPWRAYSWDRADGEHKTPLFMPDLDKNGAYDIVGAGEPTFALSPTSDPAWSLEDGCDQVIVGDFAADDKLDIMCKGRTSLAVYTHDRQKVWSADMGVRLDYCQADDVNGDLKQDLECKLGGRESVVRVDGTGKILAQSTKKRKINRDGPDLEEAKPVGAGILKGEQEFDLNGDGTAEESLKADGEALVIQSRSKKKAVARMELGGEAKAALVKDLDGKENPEIVVLTDDEIHVFDAKGEKLGSYDADAGNYKRYPVAELDSVYARKFADNEKATKAVKDAQKELSQCYERRVKGNLFVGIGQVIMKVYVDDKGKITEVEKMHSAIGDEKVEKCASDILEDLEYGKFKKPDDKDDTDTRATVNIVMKFTFADKT